MPKQVINGINFSPAFTKSLQGKPLTLQQFLATHTKSYLAFMYYIVIRTQIDDVVYGNPRSRAEGFRGKDNSVTIFDDFIKCYKSKTIGEEGGRRYNTSRNT